MISSATSTPTKKPKQAVILVHGMGEQVPMETLRGFVETMWETDPTIDAGPKGENTIWWKPDTRTGSLELSRLGTREPRNGTPGQDGRRTDFFEFYWADITSTTVLAHLREWFMSLMMRWRGSVPPTLRSIWYLLWAGMLVLTGFSAWQTLSAAGLLYPTPRWAKWTLFILMAVYGLAVTIAIRTFGDVARYVRAAPPNIAARQAIRERGL